MSGSVNFGNKFLDDHIMVCRPAPLKPTCSVCGGSGYVTTTDTAGNVTSLQCEPCGGTGRRETETGGKV